MIVVRPEKKEGLRMDVQRTARSSSPATESEDLNAYSIAQRQFDQAAGYVPDLPDGMRTLLRDASVDLRTAAFALAIQRVARVAMERGIWP
jgi:hypothetical protein